MASKHIAALRRLAEMVSLACLSLDDLRAFQIANESVMTTMHRMAYLMNGIKVGVCAAYVLYELPKKRCNCCSSIAIRSEKNFQACMPIHKDLEIETESTSYKLVSWAGPLSLF